MTSTERWKQAQEYERSHWEEVARSVKPGAGNLSWYAWKAQRTLDRLRHCGVDGFESFAVAEIGSGPVGLVSHMNAARRYALDPLMDFFDGQSSLHEERSEGVEYIKAMGEDLPLEENSCDLVVIDNCLDHCQAPDAVLRECHRVTKPGGHLYLTLNVRSRTGWYVRRLMERYALDPGHPHSYHSENLRALISGQGYEELGWWLQGWKNAVDENWSDNRVHTSLKLATLTLERLAEGVWRSV